MKNRFYAFAIILLSVACTGCFGPKKVVYFQDAVFSEGKTTSPTSDTTKNQDEQSALKDIHIQSFDVLDIRVKSSKQAFDDLFEAVVPGISNVQPEGGSRPLHTYYNSFLVDASGYVNLPILGRTLLKGLTIREAIDLISTKTQPYLEKPYVDIKFLTFRVMVMGNVRIPGSVVIQNEKSTLIDAISLAGDLNDFGNSKRIKVVRGDLTNNPKVFLVDLTRIKGINQEAFYLKPNDIVYVEPLPRKFFLANTAALISIFTILNTSIVLYDILRRN